MQIRTHRMHRVAEYGVAAHAYYKDAGGKEQVRVVNGHAAELDKDSGPYMWLRRLVDTLLEGSNPEEFLEHTKLELFQDQVFCFTPKGRLIALPRGATPLDFAYAVHTDVGNATVGSIVNGRQQPLSTVLRNGDEVQILTSKGQSPPAAWERIAVTGRARSAIRRAARDAVRKQYSELGRRLIMARFERAGVEYTDDKLKRVLFKLGQKTVDDVLAGVGRSELAITDVLRAIAPDAVEAAPTAPQNRPKNRHERGEAQDGWFNLAKVIGLKFRDPSAGTRTEVAAAGVPIRGLRGDVPVSFEEGGAVPGDRIVGVLVPGQGIKVHQIHSPRLAAFEHEHWIDVTWDIDPTKPERFPARVMVTALNEPGSLAQIAQVIGEADGNIDNLQMVQRAADFTKMLIEIEVWDLPHLTRIISGLKLKPVVSTVERTFD